MDHVLGITYQYRPLMVSCWIEPWKDGFTASINGYTTTTLYDATELGGVLN
jgi:hypothetical protein